MKYCYCRLTGVAMPSPDDETKLLEAVLATRAHLGANPTPASARAAGKAAREASTVDRSFRKLVSKYKATDDYRSLAARTRKEYDPQSARLLDVFGHHDAAAIRTEDVRTVMSKFEGSVGKAVKRVLSVLLTFAVEEGWMQANPAFGVEKTRLRKRRTEDARGDRIEGGQRPLEEAEIANVRSRIALGTRKRALFECLLGTAVRLLELGFAYEDVAEHLGHSTARMAREYCRFRRSAELRGRLFDEINRSLMSRAGASAG